MSEFSAKDAARALSELDDAEELLGQRMGGITVMVWGLVSAAIFLAYGVAETTLVDAQQAAMAIVWVPFVAAGAIITRLLWRHNAIVLGRQDDGSFRDTLLATAGFLVAAAVLFLGTRAAGIDWDLDGIMTTVNGLLAGAIGLSLRSHTRGWTHLIGASTAMIVGGILLGILDLRIGLDVLAAASICGLSWILAGYAMHQQG